MVTSRQYFLAIQIVLYIGSQANMISLGLYFQVPTFSHKSLNFIFFFNLLRYICVFSAVFSKLPMSSGIRASSDLYCLMLQLDQLTECENSSQMFNVLSDLPSTIDDVDDLISASKEVAQSLKHGLIESHRRKHLAYLMADHGAILNPEQTNNLPKQVSPQPPAYFLRVVYMASLPSGILNAINLRNQPAFSTIQWLLYT